MHSHKRIPDTGSGTVNHCLLMDSINGIEEKTHNWGRKWTEDEDLRLLQAIELYGIEDWKKVADHVGTRDGGEY